MNFDELLAAYRAAQATPGGLLDDGVSFMLPDGRVAAPSGDGFVVAGGDARSGGIQRYMVTPQGASDMGFEALDADAKFRRGLLTQALLGAGVVGAGALAAGGFGAAGAASGGAPGVSFTAADLAPTVGGTTALSGAAPAVSAVAPAAAPPVVAGPAAGSALSTLATYGPAAASAATAAYGARAASRAAEVQADAADRAADSTLTATRESNDLLRDMFTQTRADNEPWRNAGTTALSQLTAGTAPGGEFTQRFDAGRMYDDPGYQFRLDEGTRALERSAAARGGLFSSGTGRMLTRYGQDYASGEYGNAYTRFRDDRTDRFNRLASLAGVGQQAVRDTNAANATTTTNIAQNTITGANNAGNMRTSGAAARASGYVAGANSVNQGVAGGMNYYQGQRLMDLLTPRSPQPGPSSPYRASWDSNWD